MAKIRTLGPGQLIIGGDTAKQNFDADCTKAALTPKTDVDDTQTFLDGHDEAGTQTTTWTLDVTIKEDFSTTGLSAWCFTNQGKTMRLRPEKLTVSTEYIDIDEFEQTFQPSATLFAFVSNRYTRLESDDGTPATSGAWLGIGGTFTFKWRHGKPVMSNEFELQPLPMTPSTVSKWADTTPIGLPWRSVPFTWGEFSQITYFKD